MRVTYDLTALSAAGESWLEAFATHFEDEIAAWSTKTPVPTRRASRTVPAFELEQRSDHV